ncbi:MAG: hypothetical protein ACKV0T_29810 [Planctomycetales bacterium]
MDATHTISPLARMLGWTEQPGPPPEQIPDRQQRIHATVLAESRFMKQANFETFHVNDLERAFDLYDALFFERGIRPCLGDSPLRFAISSRMTSAGGKTVRYRPRLPSAPPQYEIAVSSTLLFQSFSDVERTIVVNGHECHDRLQALLRILEHEMVHLIELLLWNDSSCRGARFHALAHKWFGHTAHHHQLVTPRERAAACFGVRPGSKVRFRCDGAEYQGVVNRVTKRATVLVESATGQPYSDGKRYLRFYVPLKLLERVE